MIEEFDFDKLRRELPELPGAKRERFRREFKLPEKQVESLISDYHLANYFEDAASEFMELDIPVKEDGVEILANYLTSDSVGIMNREGMNIQDIRRTMSPKNFAELGGFIITGAISSMTAKNMLADMIVTGANPHELIQGKEQISDEVVISEIVEKVTAENPEAVASYKKGKTGALQFLAGQVMAKAKGRANPQMVHEILKKALD